MPIDAKILGFANKWYSPAIQAAQTVWIAGSAVRIVTPPYFVATKLEAFHGRGTHDVAMSHDLEDIITVVDGRSELVGEIKSADSALRSYVGSEIGKLLTSSDFVDALSGFLLPDAASQARHSLLVERLKAIAALS